LKTVRLRSLGRKYGWDTPRNTVERICRKTNGSIFEVESSEVSDIGLLVQKK